MTVDYAEHGYRVEQRRTVVEITCRRCHAHWQLLHGQEHEPHVERFLLIHATAHNRKPKPAAKKAPDVHPALQLARPHERTTSQPTRTESWRRNRGV